MAGWGGSYSPEFYKSNEIIFKNEGETNHFQTKKLWIFFHARYALQEILKEVLLLFWFFFMQKEKISGGMNGSNEKQWLEYIC